MYKNTIALEDRQKEANTMLERFSDRVPVIVEARNERAPPIDKRKFMSPRDLNFSQLMYVIRKRLSMRPEQALFFFINNTMVIPNMIVGEAYEKYKDDDGFLYMKYDLENTFGSD